MNLKKITDKVKRANSDEQIIKDLLLHRGYIGTTHDYLSTGDEVFTRENENGVAIWIYDEDGRAKYLAVSDDPLEYLELDNFIDWALENLKNKTYLQ